MRYKFYIITTFLSLLLPCVSESMEKEKDSSLYQFFSTSQSNTISNDDILPPIIANKNIRRDSQGKAIPLRIKITKPATNQSPGQKTSNKSKLNSAPQVHKISSDQDIKPKENLSQYPLKNMVIITKPSAKPGWKRYLLVDTTKATEEVCGHEKIPQLNSQNVEVCGHNDTPIPNSHTEIQK